MLDKYSFDKRVNDFELEFNEGYGDKRRTLLYSAVNFMTEIEFQRALMELLLRFNKCNLPTIRQIITIAYMVCPKAIKTSEIEPVKLKAV